MVFRQLLVLGAVVAATTASSQIFENHPPMPHEFAYGVEAPETGDVKEHKQSVSRTGRTDGEYRWLQPNGLYQVVRYYVDGDSGFQAHVSEEPGPGVGNYYSNSLSGESSVGFVPPLSQGVVGIHNPLHPGISNVITPPSHISFTGPLPNPLITAHGQTSLIPLTPTHVSVSSDLGAGQPFSSFSRPGSSFSSFSRPGNSFSSFSRPGNSFSSLSRPGNSFSTFSVPSQTFSSFSRPGHSLSSFSGPGQTFSSFSRPSHSFSSVPRPSRVSLSPTALDSGSFSTTVAPHHTSFTTTPGFNTHHQNFGGVTDGGIIHV
ncbi:uncharacterized protein LOC119583901 [Penaeus monodon]|uniref:uncharacterized protein LOC119583901 n=1 Tax=Penaeus monodon TaxID=6687 RepID=UPI0018A71169|nr:uncharacterized protein LOC119583901 [Penaeus monodon]